MTIELTARLTLSNCVSQLTDFYQTTILETIIEHGMQAITIMLCLPGGELLPYSIELIPTGLRTEYFQPNCLFVHVYNELLDNPDPKANRVFSLCITKQSMTVANLFKCALHCAGDFIKFNEKGL